MSQPQSLSAFILLPHEMTLIQLIMSEYKELKATGAKDPCLLQRTLSQSMLEPESNHSLLSTNTAGIKLYFFSCGCSSRLNISLLPQTVNLLVCISEVCVRNLGISPVHCPSKRICHLKNLGYYIKTKQNKKNINFKTATLRY